MTKIYVVVGYNANNVNVKWVDEVFTNLKIAKNYISYWNKRTKETGSAYYLQTKKPSKVDWSED